MLVVKTNHLLVFILSLGLLGCSSKYTLDRSVEPVKPNSANHEIQLRKNLTGKWYGEQPTKSGAVKWVNNRLNDGTYVIKSIIENYDGSVKKNIEFGNWGISGSIYFTIFRGKIKNQKAIFYADPSDVYNYDAYKIISVDNLTMHYRHVAYDNEYIVKKNET